MVCGLEAWEGRGWLLVVIWLPLAEASVLMHEVHGPGHTPYALPLLPLRPLSSTPDLLLGGQYRPIDSMWLP